MSDFHTGFDPYEHMVKLTHQLEQLTDQHNRLVADYMRVKARLRALESAWEAQNLSPPQ